jgi:hypothetical protein
MKRCGTTEVLTEYSKPAQDVAAHTDSLIEQNTTLLARQRRIASVLRNAKARSRCLICEASLSGLDQIDHRGIPYCACGNCGHVQSSQKAPAGYPNAEQDFADIYRPLTADAYRLRTERIYAPKRDWVLRAAQRTGIGNLIGRRWVELGSGAGHFLSALAEVGALDLCGVEAEPPLVEQANAATRRPWTRHFSGTLAEAVRQYPADVYAAWFVLEHCFETPAFLDALHERPVGTVFAFSVPTYGLGTLLESISEAHFARSLDGVLHLQLFTDRSIASAMARAGYEIRAEWLFGQDADDLYRALSISRGHELAGVPLQQLARSLTEIQSVIDRARWADSRHLLAVRT